MAAPKGNDYASKYTDKQMEAICEQLLDWAENDPSIHLANFCRKKLKKSKHWLSATAEHYPKLKVTIDQAKDLLAAKMVDSCYRDKESGVNAVFGEKYLPIYDSEYKDLLKWKAQLNNLGMNDPKNIAALQTYLDNINAKKVTE